ncbi:MAG: hypothetical protein ACTSYA_09715, partial [Candidatus Kariarchaeaceae archaeon]
LLLKTYNPFALLTSQASRESASNYTAKKGAKGYMVLTGVGILWFLKKPLDGAKYLKKIINLGIKKSADDMKYAPNFRMIDTADGRYFIDESDDVIAEEFADRIRKAGFDDAIQDFKDRGFLIEEKLFNRLVNPVVDFCESSSVLSLLCVDVVEFAEAIAKQNKVLYKDLSIKDARKKYGELAEKIKKNVLDPSKLITDLEDYGLPGVSGYVIDVDGTKFIFSANDKENANLFQNIDEIVRSLKSSKDEKKLVTEGEFTQETLSAIGFIKLLSEEEGSGKVIKITNIQRGNNGFDLGYKVKDSIKEWKVNQILVELKSTSMKSTYAGSVFRKGYAGTISGVGYSYIRSLRRSIKTIAQYDNPADLMNEAQAKALANRIRTVDNILAAFSEDSYKRAYQKIFIDDLDELGEEIKIDLKYWGDDDQVHIEQITLINPRFLGTDDRPIKATIEGIDYEIKAPKKGTTFAEWLETQGTEVKPILNSDGTWFFDIELPEGSSHTHMRITGGKGDTYPASPDRIKHTFLSEMYGSLLDDAYKVEGVPAFGTFTNMRRVHFSTKYQFGMEIQEQWVSKLYKEPNQYYSITQIDLHKLNYKCESPSKATKLYDDDELDMKLSPETIKRIKKVKAVFKNQIDKMTRNMREKGDEILLDKNGKKITLNGLDVTFSEKLYIKDFETGNYILFTPAYKVENRRSRGNLYVFRNNKFMKTGANIDSYTEQTLKRIFGKNYDSSNKDYFSHMIFRCSDGKEVQGMIGGVIKKVKEVFTKKHETDFISDVLSDLKWSYTEDVAKILDDLADLEGDELTQYVVDFYNGRLELSALPSLDDEGLLDNFYEKISNKEIGSTDTIDLLKGVNFENKLTTLKDANGDDLSIIVNGENVPATFENILKTTEVGQEYLDLLSSLEAKLDQIDPSSNLPYLLEDDEFLTLIGLAEVEYKELLYTYNKHFSKGEEVDNALDLFRKLQKFSYGEYIDLLKLKGEDGFRTALENEGKIGTMAMLFQEQVRMEQAVRIALGHQVFDPRKAGYIDKACYGDLNAGDTYKQA